MNKLFRIVVIISVVILAFFTILDRIHLAEGGDYFSGKRMLVSAIFVSAVIVLILLVRIIEKITKKRK